MLRYKTETRPGLVALYDIRPGNGTGQFLQPWSPLEASRSSISHQWPRAGSGVVRMDPLRFLAGFRTRRLNQYMARRGRLKIADNKVLSDDSNKYSSGS